MFPALHEAAQVLGVMVAGVIIACVSGLAVILAKPLSDCRKIRGYHLCEHIMMISWGSLIGGMIAVLMLEKYLTMTVVIAMWMMLTYLCSGHIKAHKEQEAKNH